MKFKTLGRTKLKVSVIGFGGIPIQRVSKDEAKKILNKALDAKINFFDTARAYSDSEEKFGTISNRRKEYYLATKSLAKTKEDMEKDIEISLKNLNTKLIELYQIHNIKDENDLNTVMKGPLKVLKEARASGKIKFIGITSHIPKLLIKAINTNEFDTVQVPFNIVERDAIKLFNVANDNNIGTIIMKPLAGGVFENKKAALKFILQYDISTIIPGMDKIEQIKLNTEILNEEFTDEEKRLIEKEARKLDKNICRRCGYCMPCPQGLDIIFIQTLDLYYRNYNLKKWAKERYRNLVVKVDKCTECGLCEEKCPYNLPIRQNLKRARKNLE